MTQLILVVCLMAAPHTCSDMTVQSTAPDSVISCIKNGLADADTWQGTHPDYSVIGWRCVSPQTGAPTPQTDAPTPPTDAPTPQTDTPTPKTDAPN